MMLPVCRATDKELASTLTLKVTGMLETVLAEEVTLIHGSEVKVRTVDPLLLETERVLAVETVPART